MHFVNMKDTIDYNKILKIIKSEIQPLFGKGKVADYIPALAKVKGSKFGMAILTNNGDLYSIGNADEYFSIQSISKVFTLTKALELIGDKLWNRVGLEPSGNKFNSLVQLEYENGKPRNPFINAGAIAVTDAIFSNTTKTKTKILQFIRNLADNQDIYYNYEVAESEKDHGYINASLANYMKSFNNIESEVEHVLDAYFTQCSIEMTCQDLCKAFSYLANNGKSCVNGNEIISARQAKRINAIMLTCGLYDAVGDFAYRVGMPGKSGVGGGIVGIIPNLLTVAVWSPELNQSGNSLIGTKALELLTTLTGKSIF